jgi:hypothetical protein
MLDLESKTICSLFMKLIPAVALAFFTIPSASHAEPLLLLHTEMNRFNATVNVRQAIKRPVDIFFNKNGDLVVQRRTVSMTMAYNPLNELIEPQERIRIAQQQDCPSISGISLKISLLF